MNPRPPQRNFVPPGSSIHDFAANLRRVRLRKAYTQEYLALEAGLCKRTVSLLECAKNRGGPTPDTVEALAFALDRSPEDLWLPPAKELPG